MPTTLIPKSDYRIGVLEDELPQAEMLAEWLASYGYDVFHADSRKTFLQTLSDNPVDAIVLDWCLPDSEGIEVLSELRQQLQFTGPILFTTARNDERDIVQALVSGADDYLVKPLRKAEFLARLLSAMRRSSDVPTGIINLGPIEIDCENKSVRLDGVAVELTPTEYRLIECLGKHPGALLSRQYLLNEVWNVSASLDTRTVDIYIGRLRRKLNIGPATGYVIRSVYRHGYRLEKIEQ
ncbi:response regulator transcription factor [Parahaliea mediterranea]|uniref:response regulator transcription factor n=1 Tax=Parahaliea mediterranea TaxID=651086 RepID=UPI000E2F276D|nr:response regulator transcription factor [Parahaliea mediterranea]